MAGFLRLLFGLVLLPACWAAMSALFKVVVFASKSETACSVEAFSLLGGMAGFALCWMTISKPMKTYVLGHELTHALWGLLFGANPHDVKVSESGGSVKLSKTNFLITLAPYFFPFYTFVVIVAALITYAFLRPLPFLPLWFFLVGFTWAFHVLFTLQTLTERQPDIKLYGRVFSWVVIFLANVALILVFLTMTTSFTFVQLGFLLLDRIITAYWGIIHGAISLFN